VLRDSARRLHAGSMAEGKNDKKNRID